PVNPGDDPELTLDYDIAVQGFGPGFVGAIDLTGGSGTVELGGVTYPAVVYERQLFGVWTLYQTFVVGPDRWYIVWAYCEGQDLAVMYFEGTDGTALDYEETVGSCAEGPGPVQASVSFPAVSMEQPALLEGFTVEGPEVSIHSGEPGMVNLGTPHVVLPFEQVDCTSGCGAPGWREIHAVLWDPAAARACFGIFYLFDGDPEILLAYALTLPDLSDPAGVLALEATWSHAP
ncbi:MAG: hypothetical protein KC731_39300, partial [Myxococcales bacterium]|nr:hypothetical protein [Myxococcales bacterium]